MKTVSQQGVLIIATTDAFYGRSAVNLAMSIRAADPDLPIALIADPQAIRQLIPEELALFTMILDPPMHTDGFADIVRMRLCLPGITPFQETLALDADMIWLPKRSPAELFTLLQDRPFTIVNEGYLDLDSSEDHTTRRYLHWADPEQLKELYQLSGRLYQVRGEFILFRKGREVNALYKAARSVQRNPGLEIRTLGGTATDEFALNIALNQTGMEPHESGWQPTYWPMLHGNLMPPVHHLYADYYAVSFGGNYSGPTAQRAHRIIAEAAANKLGLRYRFPLQSKRNYLTERRLA